MRIHPTSGVRRSWRALAAGLALVAAALPARADVHFAVMPPTQTVAPDSGVNVDLSVVLAGSDFNGFDVTVSYDPAALTLVPTVPTTAQQGCLMTGACSAACGNTFHRFAAAGDSAAISDVLLCNLISLTGPGQVYKLHFTASHTPQVTFVRIRRTTFYNAGIFVTPVATADAQITIGNTSAVDPAPATGRGPTIGAEPNPARGAVTFALGAELAGVQRLEIHDLAGRLVRVVDHGWRGAESRRVHWDGRDDSGAAVPSGIYLATFAAGDRSVRLRVAMVL
jgi:hypothetical protein